MNLRPASTPTPLMRLTGQPLRLVGAGPATTHSPAARDVARENRAASLAADLNPMDPRWVLAARTRAALQGASLTADRREQLLSLAHDLGMRPFDANLVIAIVQDEARLASAGADSAWELADRLRIVPNARLCGDAKAPAAAVIGPSLGYSRAGAALVAISALLGALGVIALIRWLGI